MNVTTKDGKSYKVCHWQEEQWLKHFEFITTTATTLVHKLELEDGHMVYVVPEEIFLASLELIDKAEDDPG